MTRDEYGMDLARTASRKSKDPSTKVGCAILRPDGTVASVGYNGAPRNANDDYWVNGPRDRKLAVTLHAELNAVLNSRDPSLDGCTAYVYPLPPCSHCSAVLAQASVARVVCTPPEEGSAWLTSVATGAALLRELGVDVTWLIPES